VDCGILNTETKGVGDMMLQTLIEESKFREETKSALAKCSPAGSKTRFVTIGDIVRYCTRDGRNTSNLLNLRDLKPGMVREIRQKLEAAKLL